MFRRFMEKRKAARDRKAKRTETTEWDDDYDGSDHVYEEIPDVIPTALQSQFRLITPNMVAPDGTGKDCSPYMVVPIIERSKKRENPSPVNNSEPMIAGVTERLNKITMRNENIICRSSIHSHQKKATVRTEKTYIKRAKSTDKKNPEYNTCNVSCTQGTCEHSTKSCSGLESETNRNYGFSRARMCNLNKIMIKREHKNKLENINERENTNQRKLTCTDNNQSKLDNSHNRINDNDSDIDREYGKGRKSIESSKEDNYWLDMDEVIYCANQNAYHTYLSSDVSMTSLQSSSSSKSSRSADDKSSVYSEKAMSTKSDTSETSRKSRISGESKLSVRTTKDRNHYAKRHNPPCNNNLVLSELIRQNNDRQLMSLL